MKDSKIYASMILSILSSSKDKQSALRAIQQNFIFQGTLRMEINQLFLMYEYNDKKLTKEFLYLIEKFSNNTYPFLANISLRPSRQSHYHSS